MLELRTERDIELLRSVALLQQSQLAYVLERNEKLSSENARLRGENPTQAELDVLKEQLAQQRQALYGRSSEKRAHEPAPVPAKAPRRGHGPTEQPNLPVEEVIHEASPEQLVCPACGGKAGPMVEMKNQTEDSDEISVKVRSYVRKIHKRKKYRCPCNDTVVTAPGPPKLIEGGRYSVEIAAEIAAMKYLYHLPLSRQEKMMRAEGLDITRQTLWDQLNAGAQRLQPTYDAHGRITLEGPMVHADESRWPMLVKGMTGWQIWTRCTAQAVYFVIQPGRGTREARDALEGYAGTVIADGYRAYGAVAKERHAQGLAMDVGNCWSHGRRKFLEAKASEPVQSAIMLDLIGELYQVEAQAPFPGPRVPPEEAERRLALRRTLRNEQSRAIVKRIHDTLLEWQTSALPRGRIGEAVQYTMNLWPGLTLFLDDPHIPVDNNAAERSLRGPVVGRKNHYGSKSQRGTEVAAIFYTLFESAKLWGVDPARYVLTALRNAVAHPGAVTLPGDLPPE